MRWLGAFCITSATAKACRGHVKKFVGSLNKEMPCSKAVLTRLNRRNKTPPSINALSVKIILLRTS
ncbi:hypothetical protein PHYSODRAFT_526227 [Phytophthora sojae]|uniref:Uncharacterized protein n=1 Tax=Phytophthora sojae (strain P6497) TaxID=1094619 RepID=G5A959_PHYSP|nr:hypothetical protein PHYSODRAFT_526227 [Phytophthora sojae]EGZ08435.1 hypothetical protein PHYSODRAFT_526227 [Phytophthora sojae]|eukprot:XP_009536607.1 hypothetical protein PHYSODRAFT_526227 [Phytophthora sojae]